MTLGETRACVILIVSKVQHTADFDRRRNGLRRRAYRDICTACRNQRYVVLLQLLIVRGSTVFSRFNVEKFMGSTKCITVKD